MRSITVITAAVLAIAVACFPRPASAQDQDLSLVINPRTGAASIRNDTNAIIHIDGYLLTSTSGVFNPAGWSTLTANGGFSGWAQGPAAANRLGEGNLFSSLALNGGASLSLGSPYLPITPTAIGQIEPSLKFEYSVAGVGSVTGDVVFSPQDNVVLIVNPASGSASLQNQSMFGVNIDGLLITTTTNALNPVGWNGFAESGIAGWTMGVAAANRLGEGNLFGSTFLPANGTPIGIGVAINPAVLDDESDLAFEYHVAGGGTITGGVVFGAGAVAILPGDYNGNGTVDVADYAVWRRGLGTTFQQSDYGVWRANFGRTLAGAGGSAAAGVFGAAVPEPSSCRICCMIGLIAFACRFPRRESLWNRVETSGEFDP